MRLSARDADRQSNSLSYEAPNLEVIRRRVRRALLRPARQAWPPYRPIRPTLHRHDHLSSYSVLRARRI